MTRLVEIPGIGPWTAGYIAMRAFGWTDAFLETDLGVKKGLAPVSYTHLYGVDINPRYLEETVARYGYMGETLECLCIDLCENLEELPQADMVIANLLVEYIGYEAFQRVVEKVSSPIVSCGIQINGEESWVSDSPYIHVFDGLDKVHRCV